MQFGIFNRIRKRRILFHKRIYFIRKRWFKCLCMPENTCKIVDTSIVTILPYVMYTDRVEPFRCRWKSILPVAWFRIFSRRLTTNRSLVVRALWNRNRSVGLFLNIGRPKGNEPANTANGFVAHRIRIQGDSSDSLFSPLEYLDIGLFPLEKFYADRWILFIEYSLLFFLSF